MSSASGTGPYDEWSHRLAAGERPRRADAEALASDPDILGLGMLADEVRRRAFAGRVTFVRVACCAFDKPIAEAVPPAARELRLVGAPATLDVALTAVSAAKAVAGMRLVSGFSLVDLQALAGGERLAQVLEALRRAGLETIAEVPVDLVPSPEDALESMSAAGFTHVRLTVGKGAAGERLAPVLRAAELAARFPIVHAINPLPMAMAAFKPTTGYEDAKAVALARLVAPSSTIVQVDWQRYGPKLAQVALTFGADDLDNVSPSDEAPAGRRRAPLEEVRRNIEAAGFVAVERDGRFAPA
jgi:aminodeoxyfutalosine synthase